MRIHHGSSLRKHDAVKRIPSQRIWIRSDVRNSPGCYVCSYLSCSSYNVSAWQMELVGTGANSKNVQKEECQKAEKRPSFSGLSFFMAKKTRGVISSSFYFLKFNLAFSREF